MAGNKKSLAKLVDLVPKKFPEPKFELKQRVMLRGREAVITGRWYALKPSPKQKNYDPTNQQRGWFYECDSDVFENIAEEALTPIEGGQDA